MAIQMLFYNIIIPFSKLGGYQYLEEIVPSRIGPNVWYDQYLIRDDGAMGYADINVSLCDYESWGLNITEERNGKRVWADLCVIGSGIGPIDYKCEWVTYDPIENTAALFGTDTMTIVTDQKLHQLRKSEGTLITGTIPEAEFPAAGITFLDNLDFGFNCNPNGYFEFFIPSKVIPGLNKDTDKHSITIHNLRKETETVFDFILEDKSCIKILG